MTLNPPISGLPLSEAAFQRAVLDLLNVRGWRSAHFHDSRRQIRRGGKVQWIGDAAAAGFPDINATRAPRVLYAELKTETGRVSATQQAWLDELGRCPGVETYIWRPSDWAEIERVLA